MTQPVPEPLHSYVAPDRDYPLANVLGARANRSRKRLDLFTYVELAGLVIIILGVLCLL